MHALAPLIHDLALMLGVAALVVVLFQRIRQPVVLGYLVAGMIIGPYTPPYGLVTDIPNIKILSELGVIFLMFSLGLEFSFQKLTRVGFSALITGLIDVSFMVVLGISAGWMMGWGYQDRLFLGAALAISSTTIIIKAIDELGLKSKRFAEVVFGVLIVEDLVAILLLVGLSIIMTTRNEISSEIFFAAIELVLVVGMWFLVGYFVVPSLFRRLAKYISQETLTIVSVALCLFMVAVAARFNYSTALGAFIMGSIIAETVLVHRIEEIIVPIRDIFGAVFFISVGMLIDPAVIIAQWQVVLMISLALVLGKVFVISTATFLTGQSVNTSVRSGFSMGQIGEFSFIIASLGLTLNVINDKLYPIIVAVSGISTFTTPYLIRFSGQLAGTLEKRLPERAKYFLESYTAWVYRVRSGSHENPLARSVVTRLLINGIIVAVIFLLINKFVFPEMLTIVERRQHAKLLSEVLAIVISSPFIWGMLFSYRRLAISAYAKSQLNPVVFTVWLATLLELLILSVVYFHTWIITAVFIAMVVVFFAVSFRQLEKSYQWFESQLVGNIKKPSSKHARYHELAPWDTHFVEMKVGNKSVFADQTLRESQIRQDYGINIVAIYRGRQAIYAPRGDEKIAADDRLIVLGNDEQLESFTKKMTASTPVLEAELDDPLKNFILKPVLLDRQHAVIGKTIRDSKIREKMKGLVVGLERGHQRILNPDTETRLETGDLLLIVAERDNQYK